MVDLSTNVGIPSSNVMEKKIQTNRIAIQCVGLRNMFIQFQDIL